MTIEYKNKFMILAMKLSPENLYKDGELNPEEAQLKENEIIKDWKKLEKGCGETVPVVDFEGMEIL